MIFSLIQNLKLYNSCESPYNISTYPTYICMDYVKHVNFAKSNVKHLYSLLLFCFWCMRDSVCVCSMILECVFE